MKRFLLLGSVFASYLLLAVYFSNAIIQKEAQVFL